MLSYSLPRSLQRGLLCVACCALTALGCERTINLTPADAGFADVGLPAEARVLDLLGPSSLELVYDEAGDLSVRLRGADGLGVSNAAVSFAIEGGANDSTLGALADTTDTEGVAHGRVLAGRSATTFRVRITAEGATPVFVQVSVSGHGFGAVDAGLSYGGSRTLDYLTIGLFAGASCAAVMRADTPADVTRAVSVSVDRVLFEGLPALVHYALQVEAVGPAGVTLARGCSEDVLVRDAETMRVEVMVDDLPLDAVGEYDTTLTLSTGALSSSVAESLRGAGRTGIADAGGDVSMLLDALNDYFVDTGDVAAVALLAADRATTTLDADLDARLLADGAGPTMAIEAMADSLTTNLERVEVTGFFTVGPDGGLGFGATEVSAGAEGAPLALLDLAPLGVHARTELTAHLLASGEGAQLDALLVQLPAGVMAQARMRATALAAGLDDTGPWLIEHAGCASFSAFIAEDPALSSRCDATCAVTACGNAMVGLWTNLAPTLGDLDLERSGVSVSGNVDFIEETGDLKVDRIYAASLVALTTGDGATPIRIEASVDANRTAFLP